MSKVILYIAQSLDGYIARPDGNIDWLTSVPYPKDGSDYGYSELMARTGTIIMGRKTYEEILGFDFDWSYTGYATFIVTSNEKLEIQTPDTSLLTGSFNDFIETRKQQSDKDIWLMGGGELIKAFMAEGLIDTMIISIIPKIIGDGIPLFVKGITEGEWTLKNTEQFETGLVNLTYDSME